MEWSKGSRKRNVVNGFFVGIKNGPALRDLFLSWLAGWEEKTHLRNVVVASRSVME
jgi:hypothetical protein